MREAFLIALIIVALILSAMELSRTKMTSTLAWAVICLSFALLIPHLIR